MWPSLVRVAKNIPRTPKTHPLLPKGALFIPCAHSHSLYTRTTRRRAFTIYACITLRPQQRRIYVCVAEAAAVAFWRATICGSPVAIVSMHTYIFRRQRVYCVPNWVYSIEFRIPALVVFKHRADTNHTHIHIPPPPSATARGHMHQNEFFLGHQSVGMGPQLCVLREIYPHTTHQSRSAKVGAIERCGRGSRAHSRKKLNLFYIIRIEVYTI